jgi:hypothetical protein
MVHINACVHDMVIISRNLKALEEELEQLDNTAQATGLIIKKKQNIWQ